MKLSLLGEPLGLTYRQLKHHQTLTRLLVALLVVAGILLIAHGDYQYLIQH